jgi:4-hydroxybenzoate polyprenyltransferase
MDIKGDAQRSAKTLAILRGRKYALCISSTLYIVFVGLTFLPFTVGWLGNVYLTLVAITDSAVLYFAFKLLKSQTDEEGRARIRQLYLTLCSLSSRSLLALFFETRTIFKATPPTLALVSG